MAMLLTGCAHDQRPATKPSGVSQHADDALRDPFGYKVNADRTDISGGSVGHLDKDGFKKDVNDVLNP
ncbi:MAG TPA: hypothetical protein VIL86_11600 [Tepidisphaeraceae bacterium]|jgi:hypothetical protein